MAHKAYKFRLKTNKQTGAQLTLFAGHCRFLWNYFWRINQDRLRQRLRIMRYGEMDFWSKLLKKSEEFNFLASAPAQILQQKLMDLDKAYKHAFDKKQPNKRLPTQRKRTCHSSFRYPSAQQFHIENKRIFLPKIGWIGFYKSQGVKGKIKSATISYRAGHWYISFLTEQEIMPMIENKSSIGIDVGIVNFITGVTENSQVIYSKKNYYRDLQSKLTKEQIKLSRKVKFSNNWKKQNRVVQKIHLKVANARRDYLHKVSTEISKNHATIFVEDLKIANMSRSARGTCDAPGTNVRAKSGLNKSILDQAWRLLRSMLEYKSSWYGGEVIAVDPRGTSQRCSWCGHKEKGNRLTQSRFLCLKCGLELNADINAAKNILAAGLSRIGLCSESQWRSAAETCGNLQISTTLS